MKKSVIKILLASALLAFAALSASSCIIITGLNNAVISSAECKDNRYTVRVYFTGSCSDPDCDILVWDGDTFLSSCYSDKYKAGNSYADFYMTRQIPYGGKVQVSPSEYSKGLSGSYQFTAW